MLAPGRNSEQPTQRNGEEYQPPAPPHQPPMHDYQPNTVNNPYCSPCPPPFVEQWDRSRPLNQLPNVPPPSSGPSHMSPWIGAQTYHQSFPRYHQQPYPQQPQWPQLEQARRSEPRPQQPEVSHPQRSQLRPQPPQRASSPMAGSPPPKRRRSPNGGIGRDNVSGIAYAIERTVLPAEEYNTQLNNIRNKHSQRKSNQIKKAKATSLDNTQERMTVEIIGREEDDQASLNEDMARVAALSHGLQHENRQGAANLSQIKELEKLKLEKDRLEEEICAIEKKHDEGKRKEEDEFYSKYIKGNSNEKAMTSSIIRINSNLAGNEEENNNMEENIVNDDSDGTVEFETMAQELFGDLDLT